MRYTVLRLVVVVAALMSLVSAQVSVALYNAAVATAATTFFSQHAMNYTYTANVIPAAGVNATLVSVTVYRQSVVSVTTPFSVDATTRSLFVAAVQSVETMFNYIQTNVAVAAAPTGVDANLYSARFSTMGYPLHYIGNALTLYPQIDIQRLSIIVIDPVRETLQGVYTTNVATFQAQKWSEYSYSQQETCIFCAAKDPKNPSRSSPSIVNVQLNQVVSVTDALTRKAIGTASFITMPAWFSIVKQAIDRSPVDSLTITYDSTTGCLTTFRYLDWTTATTASDVPTYYFADCSPILHPAETSYVWIIVIVVLAVVALLGCICGFVIWKYKCRGGRKEASAPSLSRGDGAAGKPYVDQRPPERQSGDVEMSGFNSVQSPSYDA